MCRQVEQIHDQDYRLMYKAHCRKRYTDWTSAWQRLHFWIDAYPHFEWWLEEVLVRQRGTKRKWSQICEFCQRWGVVAPGPDEVGADAVCGHCDRVQPERDVPRSTTPRSLSRLAHTPVDAGRQYQPDPPDPRPPIGPPYVRPGARLVTHKWSRQAEEARQGKALQWSVTPMHTADGAEQGAEGGDGAPGDPPGG
jgi:hypothetical protein